MKFSCFACILLLTSLISCSERDHNSIKDESTIQIYHSDSLHINFSYPSNWEVRKNGNRIGIFEELENSQDDYQENMIIWTEELPMQITDSLYAKASIAEVKIKNPSLNITQNQVIQLGQNSFHSFEFDYTNTDSSMYHIHGYTMLNQTRGYNFSCSSSKKNEDGVKRYKELFESILKTVKPL